MAEDSSNSKRKAGLLFAFALLLLGALLTYCQMKPDVTDPANSANAPGAEVQHSDTSDELPEVAEEGFAAPSEQETAQEPGFDVVRIAPDGLSVIAGKAASAGTVSLQIDGQTLAGSTVEADDTGRFVVMMELPRSNAVQVLELVHAPLDSPAMVQSSQKVFIDPTPAVELGSELASPETQNNDAAGAVQDVALDQSAQSQPRLLIADEKGLRVLPSAREPAKVDFVALDTISYTNQGDVALGGRAAGNGFVRVYLDNKPITTSRIAEDGYWSIDLPEVDSGIYTLRLDELAADGTVASRVETPFKREEPETLRTLIPGLENGDADFDFKVTTVQPGATLWAIAEDRYGSGMDFVKVFEANRDRIQNPDLIYPGQVFDMPNEP